MAASPAASLDDLVAALLREIPDAAEPVRTGQLYFLQEDRRWEDLAAVLSHPEFMPAVKTRVMSWGTTYWCDGPMSARALAARAWSGNV